MSTNDRTFYVTTPIYYVNDRPHIGHVYSTTVADVMARYHRLLGDDVFFLTGTDEHAAKVSDAAAERGLTPLQWANENAEVFQKTFQQLGMSNSDFIRTTQDRHKQRVTAYVQRLMASGDVYAGEYEGWYDAGQEEYVPENKAKEYDYRSPINGKALVRKKEKNYFFRLSAYQERLINLIERDNPTFVQPMARRNETLARLREGLNDVPMSRTGAGGWGIPIPDDAEQTIYVWIDALFNYLTTVDTDDRRKYWPANIHFIAKDILWFHAVIWPAMLMALGEPLPRQVYAHSFWISEGQKMSKSLGNFVDLEKLHAYVSEFSLDALRYFLATQGPMGATDSDFAHDRFVDVYNSDLANTLGNCASRVTNMIVRYFDGRLPAAEAPVEAAADYASLADQAIGEYQAAMAEVSLTAACEAALKLVRGVDSYIEVTQPFKLAKDEATLPQVATILYHCAESLRIASVMLWPFLPNKMQALWQQLSCVDYTTALADSGTGDLLAWAKWGQLQPGTPITKATDKAGLFPRYVEEKK